MKPAQPLIIAHRGYSSQFPENTQRAFDEGMKAGADGFECDLRLSSDGHVVIFHDDHLRRLCGHLRGSMETLTLQEIRALRVFNREPIPTLEEILVTFHHTRINLEFKPTSRPEVLVEQSLRVLTKVRPHGEIFFSSFSREVLHCLNQMDPGATLGRVGILVESDEIRDLPVLSQSLKAHTWNAPKQILKQPWATRWKHLGESLLPIWVWTVDEPDEWALGLESKLPIQALITNKPESLKRFLGHPA